MKMLFEFYSFFIAAFPYNGLKFKLIVFYHFFVSSVMERKNAEWVFIDKNKEIFWQLFSK